MRVFSIEDPVFKTATLFVLKADYDRFARLMLQRFHVSVDPYQDGVAATMLTFTKSPPWRCIWAKTDAAPVVLHEVFHLVTRICQDKGVPIRAHHENGENGDETAAYLFEFYVRQLGRRMRW